MTSEKLRRLHELLNQLRDWLDKLSTYQAPSPEVIGNLVGIGEEANELVEDELHELAAEQGTDPRQTRVPL